MVDMLGTKVLKLCNELSSYVNVEFEHTLEL